MKIRAGKFTAAVKAATKSIQSVFAPPSSMRGFYARPPPPPILNLARIPPLTVHYDSGTLEKAERPEWENVDEEVLEKVSVLKYDITRLRVDAIVNAANSSLLGGGGVDGAIHRAAGSGLLAECRKLDGCEVGEAKITGGYRLPATHIIHTVGPIYDEYRTEKEAAELLRSCYTNSLKLAVEKELKSIAFCSISTGVYGYPIDAATKEAMVAIRAFLDSEDGKKINRVIFCTFSGSDTEVYRQTAPLYFPTSKEYPAQRDTLPDIPFGVEFPASSSTPAEDTDEALTEDEVLVPRTPGRKASTRLKQKRMDEDDEDETQPASPATEADTQQGADPATVAPSQESQGPETAEGSSAAAKATEPEGADAKPKEAKEPTLYDTEVVDGVTLEGPSALPTTVALNVPGPKPEEGAAPEADAASAPAPPEEQPKAKTEAELLKEQELAQANAVPAAGPPTPLPDQETIQEMKEDAPNPPASENAEKKEEEVKGEEKKEEVTKVEAQKEEVAKAEEQKEEEAKAAEKGPEASAAEVKMDEVKAEEVKVEEAKVEEAKAEEAKTEGANAKDAKPEDAKAGDVKPEDAEPEEKPEKAEEKAEEAKAEETKADDVKVSETKVEEQKDEGKSEEKKGEDSGVVVSEPEKAVGTVPAEPPAATKPDQPTKE